MTNNITEDNIMQGINILWETNNTKNRIFSFKKITLCFNSSS